MPVLLCRPSTSTVAAGPPERASAARRGPANAKGAGDAGGPCPERLAASVGRPVHQVIANRLGWDEYGGKLLCDDPQVVEVGIHCGDLATFEAVDDRSFVRERFGLSWHTVIVADYAARIATTATTNSPSAINCFKAMW